VLQLNQHALRQTAVQVELLRFAPRALQLHTGPPRAASNPGDAVNFSREQFFNTRGTGKEKLELIHSATDRGV
jgi:hypothetical protein